MRSGHRKPHGRTVGLAAGYTAFVPAPLPPALEWNRELVNALSAADRAIGRLAGESRRLPNPHLLIRPFIRREAVLSSRIEGTQSTLTDLLAAEAGARVARDSADLHEVTNYVRALDYSVKKLETLPLSLRLVRETHRLLMTGVRGEAAAPGESEAPRTGSVRPAAGRRPRRTFRRRPRRSRTACSTGSGSCTTSRCRR